MAISECRFYLTSGFYEVNPELLLAAGSSDLWAGKAAIIDIKDHNHTGQLPETGFSPMGAEQCCGPQRPTPFTFEVTRFWLKIQRAPKAPPDSPRLHRQRHLPSQAIEV